MRFVNPSYPLSELTRDVIAGFYRLYDAFGCGFLESAYRRVLTVAGADQSLLSHDPGIPR